MAGRFHTILDDATDGTSLAFLFFLSWIAACDGAITESEMSELRSIAEAGSDERHFDGIVDAAVRADPEDLRRASLALGSLGAKQREAFLSVAIGLALDDGVLTGAEGHIIRFIADLMNVPPAQLDSIFQEHTDEAFPAPIDPSDPAWWASRERKTTNEEGKGPDDRRAASPPPATDLRRMRDLAVLGLDEAATTAEIKAAYTRLVKVHHPDRFAALGSEAVKAAEISFVRIQSAYERLVMNK